MSEYLPVRMDTFVGRDAELEKLKRELGRSRILTITGPGGIGKTRLALEAADQLAPQFAEGARFADLSALAREQEVAQAIGAVFGFMGSGWDDARAVAAYLGQTSALLVLDSCERSMPACAVVIYEVLQHCPHIAILATSRATLGVPGEAVLQLPPLGVPDIRRLPYFGAPVDSGQSGLPVSISDSGGSPSLNRTSLLEFEAIRLFADRARSSAEWFEVTSENAAEVAGLCARLDAIPLALELAAARVRSMSIDEIVKRLDDRFRVLISTGNFTGGRHRSLRSTIDWSYDLLGNDERVLFQRLSVFAGGWTLEAAERVCAGEIVERENVFDLVSRLVDRSMVTFVPGNHPPYKMLDTLREYGRSKLVDSREKGLIEARYIAWGVELAESHQAQLQAAEPADAAKPARLDVGNVREVVHLIRESQDGDSFLRLFASLGRSWYGQVSAAEARRWARECLETRRHHGGPPLVDALTHAGFIEMRIGDDDRARVLLNDAVRLGREIGDSRSLGEALWALGTFHGEKGETDEARAALGHALQIAEGAGGGPEMPSLLVSTLNALGHIESFNDHRSFELPEKLWTQAVEMSERLGMPHLGWEALGNLGEVARSRNEYESARWMYLESSNTALLLGRKAERGTSLLKLAYISLAMGAWREAADSLQEFFENDQELGITPDLTPALESEGRKRSRLAWCALGALGGVLLLAGRPEEGARVLAAALLRQGTIDALDLQDQKGIRDELRGHLGEASFLRACEAGQKLQARDALDYGLACLDEICVAVPSHRIGRLAPHLSAREQEVLRLLAAGMSNRKIAAQLFLSTRTIETHIANLYSKIGAHNRVEAARWASDAGMITDPRTTAVHHGFVSGRD